MDNLVDNQEDYQELTVREYSQLFNLPEQTVRSRLRAGRLEGVDVIRDGQTVRGVRFKLSDVHNDNQPLAPNNQVANLRLALDNPSITPQQPQVISPDYQLIADNYEERIKDLKEVINKLQKDNEEITQKLELTIKQLSEEKARAARAEGQLSSKDETIEALRGDLASKDETILSNKATVMLIEQRQQTLDAQTPKQLETSLKKPWWRLGF